MFRTNRWIILAVGGLILSLLALLGFLSPIAELARSVTLPLVRIVSGAATFVMEKTPSGSVVSAEHVAELEATLRALAIDKAAFEALKEENRVLRAQTKFLDASGYDSVGAHVISRDVRSQRALLMLDRGGKDGIELGQAVITGEGVFLGKISQLSERVSTVELVSDPESRVAASFAGEGTLTGVTEGRGNGAAAVTYVPSSAKIKHDQVVVTAGLEDKVPANLPLGIVRSIEGKPTDPFVNVVLEPLVPFDQINFVSILLPSALRPTL